MVSDRTPVRVSEQFTVDDLPRVRALVEQAAAAAGVSSARADELVAAVNEMAVNAVLYAGGSGRITAVRTDGGVQIEISDQGPGLPPGVPRVDRPPPDAFGGRGLWMAHRLFPDLTIASSPLGVTVTMFAASQ
jgi:anti-sigma regulatory factor (Ser/Thr protein kinase)